jgi:hypothetical protein
LLVVSLVGITRLADKRGKVDFIEVSRSFTFQGAYSGFMTDRKTPAVIRSLVERRLTPSQSVLFMAWLELMLETEGQTFIWAVQKWQMRMSGSYWLCERLSCIEQEAITRAAPEREDAG